MKTTHEQLKRVAPNLYRHQGNGHYYGKCKLRGKKHGPTVLKTDAGEPIGDFQMAKRAVRDWISGHEEKLPRKGRSTLAGLLETFIGLRTTKKKSTKVAENGIITHFRQHFPKPMDAFVDSVVCSDIATWLAKCGRTGRTFDRWRLFAHQLFDIAEADGIVRKSPFDPKRIKRAKKEPIKRLTPTVEEFTRIVDEIRVPTMEPQEGKHGGQRPLRQDESADFAAFLGLAGVGQAEAATLEWEQIGKTHITFQRVKTGKEFRVPIYPWLHPLLADLCKNAGASPSGRVFGMKDVRHSLNSACKRLELPRFTQRALRRCLIGRLWKSGVDRKIIAKWQGHSDGGVLITNTYTEVFGSDDASYEAEQLAKASGKIVKFDAA